MKIPIFFLGGIKVPHLPEITRSLTPSRIACVSMISEAEDVSARVEEILSIIRPDE